MSPLKLLGLCLTMCAAPCVSDAAVCTWTGAGTSDSWNLAANWNNCGGQHVVPQDGDQVIFDSTGLRANPVLDVGSTLTLVGIQITGLASGGHPYVITTSTNAHIKLTAFLVFASNANFLGAGPQFNVSIVADTGVSISNIGTGSATIKSLDVSGSSLFLNTNTAPIHITGTMSGDGTINKTGSDVLSLEGGDVANTFTGELHIQGGTVFARKPTALGTSTAGTFVYGGSTLTIDPPVISLAEPLILLGGSLQVGVNTNLTWTGNLSVNQPSNLIVLSGSTLSLDGPIDGAATLNLFAGTTVVNGNNQGFQGVLRIQSGTVSARSSGALGDAHAAMTFVETGATLALDRAVTIGQPVTLEGGQLAISASGVTVTGPITVGGTQESRIDVLEGTSGSLDGPIAGSSGGLRKVGLGTLVLNGDSPLYTRSTVAVAGTLIVQGHLSNGEMAITGATLGGSGVVGLLTAALGTVSPGTSPGILSTGNLELDAGSVLAVDLDGIAPGAGYDQLKVTGTVNLAGATLSPTLAFTPAGTTVFTIIDNDGTDPVIGTFNGLPEAATLSIGGYPATISYVGGSGNDVTLSLTVPTRYFLSEGATGAFFDEDVLIANPNAVAAPITMTFLKPTGSPIVQTRTLPPRSRTTVHVDQIAGLEGTEVSTVVNSDAGLPLAVERSMFWDATYYAGHTGSSVPMPSQDWVFAEGSQGFFSTYVLLANANATPTDVTLTFLREADTPVVQTVTVPASARRTVDCGTIPAILNRSFGITVHSVQPIVAERAMYFGTTSSRLWSGGHESAGVTAPSRTWFLAEGATGGFFDTFILLSNPQDTAATVTVQFLLDNGQTVTEPKIVGAHQRLTINIETEPDPRLANAAVSTVITSDVPIVAERSMYWIGDIAPWAESHNSFGVVQAGTHWGLAEGRVGQSLNFHTYILLANPQTTAAAVTVTFLRETGAPVVKTYTVPPTSRFNIDVNAVSSDLHDENLGADVLVTNGVAIVVERSLYWDSGGVLFKGGTNATGIPLP